MPVVDGWQATKRIRAIEGLNHTLIVACTANVINLSDDQQPFDGVIFKPIRKNVFLEELRKYQQMSQSGHNHLELSNNNAQAQSQINQDVLMDLKSRFGARIKSACDNFAVSELETLIAELEVYSIQHNDKILAELVASAKDHVSKIGRAHV